MIGPGAKRLRRWTFRQTDEEALATIMAARYVGLSVSDLARIAVAAYVTATRKTRTAQGHSQAVRRRRRVVARMLAGNGEAR